MLDDNSFTVSSACKSRNTTSDLTNPTAATSETETNESVSMTENNPSTVTSDELNDTCGTTTLTAEASSSTVESSVAETHNVPMPATPAFHPPISSTICQSFNRNIYTGSKDGLGLIRINYKETNEGLTDPANPDELEAPNDYDKQNSNEVEKKDKDTDEKKVDLVAGVKNDSKPVDDWEYHFDSEEQEKEEKSSINTPFAEYLPINEMGKESDEDRVMRQYRISK